MKNLPLLIGTIVGTVALIVVIAIMSSGGQTSDTTQQVTDSSLLIGDAPHIYKSDLAMEKVTLDNDTNTQNPDAIQDTTRTDLTSTHSAENTDKTQENQELITIVEFSDFQCPACKAALPAVERVKSTYPGQVQIVYRHFPLDSIHPNARLAALASEAAASLDETKFWSFHDKLFAEQQTWSEISSRTNLKETFATYAQDLGLDKAQFLEKMEDKSLADLVNQDVAAATQLNVNSTPTFYVNGTKTSVTELLTAVDSLISK